jgi:hypothetical protein
MTNDSSHRSAGGPYQGTTLQAAEKHRPEPDLKGRDFRVAGTPGFGVLGQSRAAKALPLCHSEGLQPRGILVLSHALKARPDAKSIYEIACKSAVVGFLAAFLFVLMAASAAMPDTAPETPSWVTPLPISKISVAAGKPARVQLRFKIADGYHINSNQPGSELLIPTKLQLNPPTDIGVGSITYPRGHDLTLELAPGEKLNVYTGEFIITGKVSATRSALPGKYMVHGQLKYQACNDRSCFPPKLAPVEFEILVLKSRLRKGPAHNPPQSPHAHN